MEKNIGKTNNLSRKSVEDILEINTKTKILKLSLASFNSILAKASNIDLDNFCQNLRVPIGLPRDLKKQKLRESFVAEKAKSSLIDQESDYNDFDQDGVLPKEKRESLENWMRS